MPIFWWTVYFCQLLLGGFTVGYPVKLENIFWVFLLFMQIIMCALIVKF